MSQPLKNMLLWSFAVAWIPACTLEADRETEANQSALHGADQGAAGSPAAAANGGRVSPNGEELGTRPAPSLVPLAANASACFQLNSGSGTTWFVNASVDLNAYPYAILGGSISGTICDSPNWTLTGGSVGASLTINGSHTGAVASCVGTVAIVGSFGPPDSYPGTYGFDGANNQFTHRTLFLGYNRACP